MARTATQLTIVFFLVLEPGVRALKSTSTDPKTQREVRVLQGVTQPGQEDLEVTFPNTNDQVLNLSAGRRFTMTWDTGRDEGGTKKSLNTSKSTWPYRITDPLSWCSHLKKGKKVKLVAKKKATKKKPQKAKKLKKKKTRNDGTASVKAPMKRNSRWCKRWKFGVKVKQNGGWCRDWSDEWVQVCGARYVRGSTSRRRRRRRSSRRRRRSWTSTTTSTTSLSFPILVDSSSTTSTTELFPEQNSDTGSDTGGVREVGGLLLVD